jgi:outer membrane lipoprotein SlyB
MPDWRREPEPINNSGHVTIADMQYPLGGVTGAAIGGTRGSAVVAVGERGRA